jgi:hypothetical protein
MLSFDPIASVLWVLKYTKTETATHQRTSLKM